MTTKSQDHSQKTLSQIFNLEILITIITLVIAAVIYSFTTFSYANSTYVTKSESEIREQSWSKDIQSLKDTSKRIENKLDKVLGLPTDD